MMRSNKIHSICFIASIIGFLLLSASFLLMPIGLEWEIQGSNLITYLAGLLFWFGLLLGVLFQIIVSVQRKNYYKRNKTEFLNSKQPRLGLISFFQNKKAKVFDALAGVTLVGGIISVILTDARGYVCYVFIALFTFSFCAHCIYNGKNYYFIKNKESIKKTLRKKRAKSSG